MLKKRLTLLLLLLFSVSPMTAVPVISDCSGNNLRRLYKFKAVRPLNDTAITEAFSNRRKAQRHKWLKRSAMAGAITVWFMCPYAKTVGADKDQKTPISFTARHASIIAHGGEKTLWRFPFARWLNISENKEVWANRALKFIPTPMGLFYKWRSIVGTAFGLYLRDQLMLPNQPLTIVQQLKLVEARINELAVRSYVSPASRRNIIAIINDGTRSLEEALGRARYEFVSKSDRMKSIWRCLYRYLKYDFYPRLDVVLESEQDLDLEGLHALLVELRDELRARFWELKQ